MHLNSVVIPGFNMHKNNFRKFSVLEKKLKNPMAFNLCLRAAIFRCQSDFEKKKLISNFVLKLFFEIWKKFWDRQMPAWKSCQSSSSPIINFLKEKKLLFSIEPYSLVPDASIYFGRTRYLVNVRMIHFYSSTSKPVQLFCSIIKKSRITLIKVCTVQSYGWAKIFQCDLLSEL